MERYSDMAAGNVEALYTASVKTGSSNKDVLQ